MILFFSEDEVEVLFQKAIKQIKQEQFEEAADNLLNAAEGFAQFELFRRVGDCYVLRGEVLDELKLFKEATGAFERSIPFFYRADFILGVGKAYLLLARLGRRQYKIDKAKQQDPFATLQAVSDYERAHGIVLKAGYRLEAEEIRKELEPIYYSDIPAATMIFENAQIVYKADNISLAELMDTYKKLTQDYPTFLPAATELGMLYAQLGQRETAKSIFEQILVRDCRRAHVYVNLGNIYSELELFDEAATNYQKAIKLNPTLVFALTGLELTYRKQGVHYLRIDLLRQLTKLKPNDAMYYVLMGDAYLKQHLLSEATTAFQEALRRNDNEASVHQLLGIILIGQGKVTSGHQHLMRAKILDSNDVETHLYLASSWILQERFDEAQSHLELFARRQPFWVRLFYGFRQAVSINEKGAHYLVNWGMDRLAANYPYFALPCFLAAAKLYDYLAKQGVKPEESLLSKLGRHRKRVPHGTDKYPFPELGIAYLNQGVTYDAMNIWELSLTAFKQAREVFSNLGPTFQADLVVALHGIAQAYRYLRKFPESLAYLQQAERLIAKTSDDLTHGRMIFNQAGMLKSIDRLNECLDAYQRASTLFEQIQKGQIDLAKCLSGLADLTDTVANYLEEAEKKQLDLTKTQPGSYNLMDIAQRLFEVEIGGSRLASSPKIITVNALYELALKFEQRSFDLISHLEKVGYVSIDEHEFGQKSYITQDLQPIEVQVALSSRVLAFRYGRLGQFDPGHKRLDAAEKTFEHYKAVGGIDQLWLTRGFLFLWEKKFQKAIEAFQRNIQAYQQSTWQPIQAYRGLADTFYTQKAFSEAYRWYRRTIDRIEANRGSFVLKEYRSGYFSKEITVYDQLILSLYKAVKQKENQYRKANTIAYEYVERSKSRVFLEQLGQAELLLNEQVPPHLMERIREQWYQLRALQMALANGWRAPEDLEKLSSLQKKLNQTLTQEVSHYAPEFVSLLVGKPVLFEEVCSLLTTNV